jgi:hypothetical protein
MFYNDVFETEIVVFMQYSFLNQFILVKLKYLFFKNIHVSIMDTFSFMCIGYYTDYFKF